MRGERELCRREAAGLSAQAATQFVRQAAADLLRECMGTHVLPPDAVVEARQLARRAEDFFRLGGWDEAAVLAEASLLLQDGQTRMHLVAALSLGMVAGREASARGQLDANRVFRGIYAYLRALEHYEMYLPAVTNVENLEQIRLRMCITRPVLWSTF